MRGKRGVGVVCVCMRSEWSVCAVGDLDYPFSVFEGP